MNRGRLGVIAFACSIVAGGVAAQTTSMTVIASGLNGPRGLSLVQTAIYTWPKRVLAEQTAP